MVKAPGDPTAELFDSLAARGHEPLLERASGMLGLEPLGDHLVVDPALPVGIGHLELLDLPGRWGRLDAFGRGRVQVNKRGRR